MSEEKQIEEMARDLYAEIEYDTWHYYDDNYTEVTFDYRKTAENIYNKGYRKQEWISVDERLPEDDLPKEHKKKTIKVIVAIKAKNGITIRTQERFLDYTYSNGGERKSYWHWRFSHGEVTHWMPLPEPPKMKGGE